MSETDDASPIRSEALVREELEKAVSLISGARRLMAEGRSIDLSALEDRVRTITTALQALPAPTRIAYKEHLEVLSDILDSLESDMEARFKALQDSLDALKRREATGAYGPKDKA